MALGALESMPSHTGKLAVLYVEPGLVCVALLLLLLLPLLLPLSFLGPPVVAPPLLLWMP
jgi:hypothetical protein